MTAVQAIYDGDVFIPEKPCDITKGSKVTLTINPIGSSLFEKSSSDDLTVAVINRVCKEVDTSLDPGIMAAQMEAFKGNASSSTGEW